jgi:hypothetical protein
MVPFTIQQWREIKEQHDLATGTQEETMEIETLVNSGFESSEVICLLKLRQWYQSGGSDRIILQRYWEFLKQLVQHGKLEA